MNELTHYGVKGMKWGIRKKDERKALKQQRKDNYAYGKKRYGATVNLAARVTLGRRHYNQAINMKKAGHSDYLSFAHHYLTKYIEHAVAATVVQIGKATLSAVIRNR